MSQSGDLQSVSLIQRAAQALKYGRDLDPIRDYRVGNIHSDRGVLVMSDAAVVGDIEAERVVVFGLVYGFIAAQEVIIEEGGQIWGDVYSAAFQLKPGGKVHGWISSLDEKVIENKPSRNGLDDISQTIDPTEFENLGLDLPALERETIETAERAAIWRQLQAEAAVAIMARLELEKSFGDRVDEVSGQSLSESSRLRDEVLVFREERSALENQIEVLEEEVESYIEKIETKTAELTHVRKLMDDQKKVLEELQAVFEQQSLKYAGFEAERQELKTNLTVELKRTADLEYRVENLESALQASLQHTAEQEEALIRWQELAEVTEKRAATLEGDLEATRLQMKESSQVLEMVRKQREKLESEFHKTDMELREVSVERDKMQAEIAAKNHQMKALEKERDELQLDLAALQERFDRQPPEYEQMLAKYETLAETNQEMNQRLAVVEKESQDYNEQWLWTKASLETASSELDALRLTKSEYEETIQQLQKQNAEQEKTVETWKNSVGRMTDLLYEAESKAKELEKTARDAQLQAQDTTEKDQLQEEIRKQQLQIEAYESEVADIHREIESQSQHLAEIQATLIEKEIAITRFEETAEKQAVQLDRVKRMAAKRIRGLEGELTETRQKLQDLSVWLERRQKREENE